MRIVCADYQMAVIQSSARFISMMAGRRVGKTFAFMVRAADKCIRIPRFKYWYVAPAYAQSKEVFETIVAQEFIRRRVKRFVMQPYPRIIFNNGSEMGFRTFERPKNLRGAGIGEIWIDEIQDIRELDFNPVILPLVAVSGGTVIISGQFRGYNWYHDQLYLPGLDDSNPDFDSFRIPSSRGMAFQGDNYKNLLLLKDTMTKVEYDQECNCIPTANQNAVWDAEDIEACKTGVYMDYGHKEDHPTYNLSEKKIVVGVDLGTKADPTGIVVAAIDSREKGHVLYSELRPEREKHSKIAQRVEKIREYYGGRIVMADTTGGAAGGQSKADAVIKWYKKYVKNLKCHNWNQRNKAEAVRNLELAIENKNITVGAGNKQLLSEMQLYEVNRKGDYERYDGPGGKRDNLTTSLMIAWVAAFKGYYNRDPLDLNLDNATWGY